MAKSVRGKARSWQLLEVIGSGDAGEVLLVRQELGEQIAVLKRPLQNVSGGTILRQAAQIEREGEILARLAGVNARRNSLLIHTPLLLDESIQGTSQTANYFIVSEQVRGESISSLLKQLFQGEANFSQVLVLKVLGATFELLRQAHRLGVLWNDVKMEHIFWERSTDQLSFIDWGNGLLLDPDSSSPAPDPYSDFAQLLSEGTLLLNQVAPDLAAQVGWPAPGETLSLPEIEQLQFRIDYLLTYLSMRVLEDELIIKKAALRLQDVETLRLALETKAKLERAGQTPAINGLFVSAAALVEELVRKQDWQSAREVIDLVLAQKEALGEARWVISARLLSSANLEPGQPLQTVLIAVMKNAWPEAAWHLNDLRLNPATLAELLQAIRETALPKETDLRSIPEQLTELMDTLHIEIIRQRTLNPDDNELPELLRQKAERINQTLQGWSVLTAGEYLGDKLLSLREDLTALAELGLDLARKLVTRMSALVPLIRAVYHNWRDEDFSKTHQSLMELYLADPGMAYLFSVQAHLDEAETWMRRLREGPNSDESLTRFARELKTAPLVIQQELGIPPWLELSLRLVDIMSETIDLEQLQELARREEWPFPWLEFSTIHLDLPGEDEIQRPLDQNQKAALDEFYACLMKEPGSQNGLQQVRLSLPRFYSAYKQLQSAFSNLFPSRIREKSNINPAEFPLEDQPRVEEACQVLATVLNWENTSRQGQLISTSQTPDYSGSPWLVLRQLDQTSKNWRTIVLPILTEIRQKHWAQLPRVDRSQPHLMPLFTAQDALSIFIREWERITYQGFYLELARNLLSQMEIASEAFFKFWQQSEQSPNPAIRFLVTVNQSFFSDINNTFLQVERHLRSTLHALEVIRQPELARTRLAQNSAGDLMFALVQLQDLVKPPSRGRNVIRDWQQQYLNLLKSANNQQIREGIQNIESIHPLLPWFDELAKRDVDYFDLSDQRKW